MIVVHSLTIDTTGERAILRVEYKGGAHEFHVPHDVLQKAMPTPEVDEAEAESEAEDSD